MNRRNGIHRFEFDNDQVFYKKVDVITGSPTCANARSPFQQGRAKFRVNSHCRCDEGMGNMLRSNSTDRTGGRSAFYPAFRH